MAVYANCINTNDASILVVSAAFVLPTPGSPLFASIIKLDFTEHVWHTRESIAAVLKDLLPQIKVAFPQAELFLVRDGNSVNSDVLIGGFTLYDGYSNIYCLMHMLAARVASVSTITSKSSYLFRDAKNKTIPVEEQIGKQFINLPQHLLKRNMKSDAVARILAEMARTDKDSQIWLCLNSSPGDKDRVLKQMMMQTAELHEATVGGGTSRTEKGKLERYQAHLAANFKFTYKNKEAKRLISWHLGSTQSLETIIASRNEIPLKLFTLFIDESIKSSARRYSNGEIHGDLDSRPISFDSVVGTVDVLINKQLITTNSMYGKFPTKIVLIRYK